MSNYDIEGARRAVEVLNRALKKDPVAINFLFSNRERLRAEGTPLKDDETIQVRKRTNPEGEVYYTVGALGVINGLFGIKEDGYGLIFAVCEGKHDDWIIRFELGE